jgi:hypothetical protein
MHAKILQAKSRERLADVCHEQGVIEATLWLPRETETQLVL